MNLLDFIKIKAKNDSSPIGDFCKDILSDPHFPFDSENKAQLEYLKNKGVIHSISNISDSLKMEYEKYLLKPDYENENMMDSDGIDSYMFKSGEWSDLQDNVIFEKVLFVGDENEYYKAYLISKSSDLALFMELNNPMDRPSPQLFELSLILRSTHGDSLSKDRSIEVFERLLISPYAKNKFLVRKGLQLLRAS